MGFGFAAQAQLAGPACKPARVPPLPAPTNPNHPQQPPLPAPTLQEPADLTATSEDEASSDEEGEPNPHQALVPTGGAAAAKRWVGGGLLGAEALGV